MPMSERIQIRLISLLEEAANSFEQLETLANRSLQEIPSEQVEEISLVPMDREMIDSEDSPVVETDQVIYLRYRVPAESFEE